MRKGLTEVVFILDRSGSMRGLEEDTIGGFNSMIEKQRKEEGEVLISTVLFDSQCEVLYDRVPVDKIEPLVGVSRQPRVFNSVDLPEPDVPMMVTNSPSVMEKETPRRAWTVSSPT